METKEKTKFEVDAITIIAGVCCVGLTIGGLYLIRKNLNKISVEGFKFAEKEGIYYVCQALERMGENEVLQKLIDGGIAIKK